VTAPATPPYQAVVFDMDGLLLDTESIAYRAFMQANDELGYQVPDSLYLKIIGTNAAGTEQIIRQGMGSEYPYTEVRERWLEKYQRQAIEQPVPIKPGVLELLDHLEAAAIPKAVATSSYYRSAERKLGNAGLLERFAFVVAGDQVKHSKPAPEIYLKAARGLDTCPSRCLALEDSDNGVRAAHGAGMTVVQIPDLTTPCAEVRALGHLITESLHRVPALLA